MNRTNRKRIEALEAQKGPQACEDRWNLIWPEVSDSALAELIEFFKVVEAGAAPTDGYPPLTTDQEIELLVILNMDAPNPETLARWTNWAGLTRPGDEELDQEIDFQVRELIAGRAARLQVTP
jgi:hypothetical protein